MMVHYTDMWYSSMAMEDYCVKHLNYTEMTTRSHACWTVLHEYRPSKCNMPAAVVDIAKYATL